MGSEDIPLRVAHLVTPAAGLSLLIWEKVWLTLILGSLPLRRQDATFRAFAQDVIFWPFAGRPKGLSKRQKSALRGAMFEPRLGWNPRGIVF